MAIGKGFQVDESSIMLLEPNMKRRVFTFNIDEDNQSS